MSLASVRLRQSASIPLAVIRGTVRRPDLSRIVPEWCGLVWTAVRAQQTKAGRHVALYWDDSVQLEVGVELLGPFIDRGDVVCSATPAGLVASVTHLGPYLGLGAAHEAVRAWTNEHGHHRVGPWWEIYGHWQPEWSVDPSRIRTDVCYLVEPG